MSQSASHVWLLFRRNWREALRNPVIAFVFPVVFPLLAITLISQAFGRIVLLEGFPTRPYVAYLAPSMLLLAGMMGSGYSAAGIVIDARTGFLDRLRLLPIRPGAVLASRLLFDVLRVGPASVLVLGFSAALGAHLESGPAGLAALVGLSMLWSVSYSGIFYVVTLRTKNPQTALALAPLFIPLLFLSPGTIPETYLPEWIQTIARFNPYTYVVAAARTLMTAQPEGSAVLAALGMIAGIALVTGTVTLRSFQGLTRT